MVYTSGSVGQGPGPTMALEKTNKENPEPARHLVAIVGRPNVGKSAIFNRLAGRSIAIVHDQPGVTRDRITAPARSSGQHPFSIIDTGGIGAALDDGFTEQVAAEVDIAMETADLILFVVDGASGINAVDETLARQLRQTSRPVILLVNKIDHDNHTSKDLDFASLGFSKFQTTSAAHGRGFDELLGRIDDELGKLPPPTYQIAIPTKEPIKVAIVGRPNVGKSSLINAILGEQRTIVSDVAGTTRDSVDVPYELGGKNYNLIDTAGIRRRTKIDNWSKSSVSCVPSAVSVAQTSVPSLLMAPPGSPLKIVALLGSFSKKANRASFSQTSMIFIIQTAAVRSTTGRFPSPTPSSSSTRRT